MSSANGFHASRHHTPHIPDFSSSPALSPVHTSPKSGLVPSYDDHWTYEQIVLKRVPGISLGFSIAGGVDNPMFGNNTHVFVTKLTQDGLAELDGRLRANDILYKVNDTVLEDVEHAEAVQALREAGKIVNLTVKRLQPTLVKEISLENTPNGLGFSISGGMFTEHVKNDHGLFVTKIWPGGEADLDGKLSVGDRILSVNGISLEYVSHEEAVAIIGNMAEQCNQITLKVGKVTHYVSQDQLLREPRLVCLKKGPQGLGFNIVGGIGGDGIFVSFILTGGSADLSGELRKGDQILSVNDIDVTQATHEQAAEILKNVDTQVFLLVEYRPEAYDKFQTRANERREQIINSTISLGLTKAASASNIISTLGVNGNGASGSISNNILASSGHAPGALSLTNLSSMFTKQRRRSLYVRTLFMHDPSKDSGIPGKGLGFNFGEILHIVNASDEEWWQARRVNADGTEEDLGIVPSKQRVERRERARQRRVNFRKSLVVDPSSTYGVVNTASKTASLDSRKKMGGVLKIFKKAVKKDSHSSDELSDQERNQEERILSYEPVIQQEIIIFGPLKDRVSNDLIYDFPDRFGCCVPRKLVINPIDSLPCFINRLQDTTRPRKDFEVHGRDYYFYESREQMERDIQNHQFIEAGQFKGNLYGTSVQSVRSVAEKGRHCILEVSPKAIKRLKTTQLYPIAILIKPISVEWIMDMNKRISSEEAKELFEIAEKLEQMFGESFTVVVQAHTYEEIYEKCKEAIAEQAGPVIWVPSCEPI